MALDQAYQRWKGLNATIAGMDIFEPSAFCLRTQYDKEAHTILTGPVRSTSDAAMVLMVIMASIDLPDESRRAMEHVLEFLRDGQATV